MRAFTPTAALRLALVAVVASGTAVGACASSPMPSATTTVPSPRAASSSAAIAWSSGPPLTASRDHHATFIAETAAGPFLFVVGGSRVETGGARFLADAFRARIAKDGSLEAWTAATPLPSPRAGMGVVLVGDHVVLTAGKEKRAKEQTTGVFLSTVGADGSLAAWRDGPPIPAARFHHTSVFARGGVYVIGGLGDDMTSTATVFRAALRDDGSLGAWSTERAMPDTRSHHAAFVHGDWLYVAGGLRGNPTHDDAVTELADVLRAHVEADGALGAWEPTSKLDVPLATHAAVVHAEHVYLVGGLEEEVTNRIRRAPFGADGVLGAWESVTPLPRARAHVHQTPVFAGRMYTVSGNGGNHGTIPDVSIGELR